MARSVSDRRHSTQDGISSKSSRRITKRFVKTLMRSYKFKLPNYDLPLRIRPVSNPSSLVAFSTKCFGIIYILVVRRNYHGDNANFGIFWLHEIVSYTTLERTNHASCLLVPRHNSFLLYF